MATGLPHQPVLRRAAEAVHHDHAVVRRPKRPAHLDRPDQREPPRPGRLCEERQLVRSVPQRVPARRRGARGQRLLHAARWLQDGGRLCRGLRQDAQLPLLLDLHRGQEGRHVLHEDRDPAGPAREARVPLVRRHLCRDGRQARPRERLRVCTIGASTNRFWAPIPPPDPLLAVTGAVCCAARSWVWHHGARTHPPPRPVR